MTFICDVFVYPSGIRVCHMRGYTGVHGHKWEGNELNENVLHIGCG